MKLNLFRRKQRAAAAPATEQQGQDVGSTVDDRDAAARSNHSIPGGMVKRSSFYGSKKFKRSTEFNPCPTNQRGSAMPNFAAAGMSPMQIKKQIQKLAEGMKEAEANKHDHALHNALEQMVSKHGSRKVLRHLAYVFGGPGIQTGGHDTLAHDLPTKPKEIAKTLESLTAGEKMAGFDEAKTRHDAGRRKAQGYNS